MDVVTSLLGNKNTEKYTKKIQMKTYLNILFVCLFGIMAFAQEKPVKIVQHQSSRIDYATRTNDVTVVSRFNV